MSKQIQDAYIVAATRLPVAKRKGMFGHVRPDDMLAHVIKSVVAQVPGIDPALIGDVIVGCAMPEAEQGMNVARIGLLLAGLCLGVQAWALSTGHAGWQTMVFTVLTLGQMNLNQLFQPVLLD